MLAARQSGKMSMKDNQQPSALELIQAMTLSSRIA
jgi:hypothetical protein